MFTCPVCFFNGLRYPPADYTICPCCYTEFGLDDAELSHEQLRRLWIVNGLPWMAANITPPPPGWNPYQQLIRAGVLEVERETADEPSVSVVDFGRTQRQVAEGATIYGRLIAIGATSGDLLRRAHYANA
jgi:hypothetical protein